MQKRWPAGLLPNQVNLPGLRFMKRRGASISELDVVAHDVPVRGYFCWWGSACNIPEAVLDTGLRLRGFHRYGPVLRLGEFSVIRLRATTPVRVTPRTVSSALTTSLPWNDGLFVQRGRA